jgi:hypothetical protein
MQLATVQQSQNLGDGQASRNGADEWRTDGLSCQEGDATLVQVTVFQQLLVGRPVNHVVRWRCGIPYLICGAGSWQRVQADCTSDGPGQVRLR